MSQGPHQQPTSSSAGGNPLDQGTNLQPLDIAILKAEIALTKQDPVRALKSLGIELKRQGQPNEQIVQAICRIELRELQPLLESGDYTQELLGCLMHTGDLLDQRNFDSSSHGTDYPTYPLDPDLESAVCTLMMTELSYLAELDNWQANEIQMVTHACGILSTISALPAHPENSRRQEIFSGDLSDQLIDLLDNSNFKDLCKERSSIEAVQAVHACCSLVHQVAEPRVTMALIDHIELIYDTCSEIDSYSFDLAARNAQDEAEDQQEEAEDEEDQDVGEDLPDFEPADDTQGYEIIRPGDPEYLSLEYQDACVQQEEYLLEEWTETLRAALLCCRIPDAFLSRTDVFHLLLVCSPFEMPCYQEALDALVFASQRDTQEFIPELVRRCLDPAEQLGVKYLIDLSGPRPDFEQSGIKSPREYVVSALRDLPRQNRLNLLRVAREVITNDADEFDDSHEALRTVQSLHDELKKPKK